MKSAGFLSMAAAALGAKISLEGFINESLLKELKVSGKQKYLKRCADTFAAFQKKQNAQKAKIKGPADHGYHAKLKSNYRKNRDLAIYKIYLSVKSLPWEKKLNAIFSGNHPGFSDRASVKYVLNCVKRVRALRRAKIYATSATGKI